MKNRITVVGPRCKQALFSLCFLLMLGTKAMSQITGSTTVYVGTSTTYSYTDGGVIAGPSWTASKGTVTSTSVSGTTYYATVSWTATGSGNVKLTGSVDGTEGILGVTVSACSISAPTKVNGTISRCGPGSVTLQGAVGSGGTVLRWYTSATGGSVASTGTTYQPTLTTSNASYTSNYYMSTYNPTTMCESTRTLNSATFNPIPVATATPSPSFLFVGSATSIVISSNVTGVITNYSYTVSAPNISNAVAGTASPITQSLALINGVNSATATYSITPSTSTCTGSPTTTSVAVYAMPVITVNGVAAVSPYNYYSNYGYGKTLGSTLTYSSTQWYKNGTGPSNLITGATGASYQPMLPGTYYLKISITGTPTATTFSTGINILEPNVTSDSVNQVSRTLFYKSGQNTTTTPYTLNPQDLVQSIVYADGLGRVVQNVQVGQSPLGGDLIKPIAYGKNGYADSTLLPYATTNVSGNFHHNAIRGSIASTSYNTSEQYKFYQAGTAPPKTPTDLNPYSRNIYRNTPDARVIEDGLTGAAWQPGSTHTIRNQLSLSSASSNPVRLWNPDGTTTGNYPDRMVWITTTTDENNHLVNSYTDKRGLVVLKQTQSDATTWISTYFIYDNYGQLIYQLSPKVLQILGTGSSLNANSPSVANLIYKYKYDLRGRIIEKTVPGSAVKWIVYDQLDRVALTQDANQRAQGIWMFIKYDYKNRPVYFGQMASTSTRNNLQSQFDAINYTTAPYFETATVNATYQGYSNVAFPTTGLTVLGANYYDNYDFNRDGTADYLYDNTHLAGTPTAASTSTRGLATGTKKLILGTTNWLISCVFYDNLDRPLQTLSNNHLNVTTPQDKITVLYFSNNLSQNPQQIKVTHVGATTVNYIQRYTYDNGWRVNAIYNTLNSNAEQQIVGYEYNALGQIVTKKLHNTGGANFMQNVDMRYNIRGWLTSINNAGLTNDGGLTNSDPTGSDYFGMELFYNNAEQNGLGNTGSYNGNISATKWKGQGAATGLSQQRSYVYSYDYSDRLTSATFQANSGTAWNTEVNTLNESMTYDSYGNILKLLRNKNLPGLTTVNGNLTVTSTPGAIDSLTYFYANGNQISKVNDSGTTEGFSNGVTATSEYTYDSIGNTIRDGNKLIDSIKYNVLGKPVRIKFHNGNLVTYIYDALGTKQTMKSVRGAFTTVTDYVGGFVYLNSVISNFPIPEGRVTKNPTGYEYQYFINDHQGNTRVLFTSASTTPTTITAGFENPATEIPEFDCYGSYIYYNPSVAHTGSYVCDMQGSAGTQIAVAKSYHMYAGDRIELSGYAQYANECCMYSSNLPNFASVLLSAFHLAPPAVGETNTASSAISAMGTLAAGSYGDGSTDESDVRVFFTILVFDKNYNLIDTKYQQVTGQGSWEFIDLNYTSQQETYVYAYISNEDQSLMNMYIDDVAMTYTPSNILQYNEYYPFGLQTASSWTRVPMDSVNHPVVPNNFLANGATELNEATALYDLDFRNYDPALARLTQVDPYADYFSAQTPYHFVLNNPVNFTDRMGLGPGDDDWFFDGDSEWKSNDTGAPLKWPSDNGSDAAAGGHSGEDASKTQVVGVNITTWWLTKQYVTDDKTGEELTDFTTYSIDTETQYIPFVTGGGASQGNLTFSTFINFENNLSGAHLGQTFVDRKGSSFKPNANGGYDINIKLVIYLQKRVIDPKFLANNPTIDLQLLAHELAHVLSLKEAYLGPVNILGEMNTSGLTGQDLSSLFDQLINYGSNEAMGKYTEKQTTLRGQQFLPQGVNMNYLLNDWTINLK